MSRPSNTTARVGSVSRSRSARERGLAAARTRRRARASRPARTLRSTPSTARTRPTSRRSRPSERTGKCLCTPVVRSRTSLMPRPRGRPDCDAAGGRRRGGRRRSRRERRQLVAALEAVRAARRERAAGRRPSPVGGAPGIAVSRRGRGVQTRDRAEQAPRVRVCGSRRPARRALLDHAARVHHEDPVGDPGDHAHVVRDQHDGHPVRSLQRADQLEDLGLDGHVERGRRLVGDQQLRVARERHRDHHALAHAAGELVREARRAAPARGCRPIAAARPPARARRARDASCTRICSAIWSPTV